MEFLKRKRARAIVVNDSKLVSMYREFDDRSFYVFPGGGMEGNESEEECVIREVYEEFGITVKPIKKVYVYETEKSIEYFYLCEFVSQGKECRGIEGEYDGQVDLYFDDIEALVDCRGAEGTITKIKEYLKSL